MHQALTDCGMRESQDRRMSQRLTRPLPLSSLLRVQHQERLRVSIYSRVSDGRHQ